MNTTTIHSRVQLPRRAGLCIKTAIAGFMLGILFSIPGLAYAASRPVTNTLDSGAGSLRDTLGLAQAGDTVVFDSNVFSVPQTITLNSQVYITTNLTIAGPTSGTLTVSGQNVSRIFNALLGNDLAISNMTLRDGNPGFGGGPGGAIYVGGALSLTSVTVFSNTANDNGGALYAVGAVTLTNCLIVSNTSTLAGGGLWVTNTLAMTNTQFVGNQAGVNGRGGGAFVAVDAAVNGGEFKANHSGNDGGGLYVRRSLTVTGTQFIANAAGFRGGGAFVDASYGGMVLVNGLFRNNTATKDGGGVDSEGVYGLTVNGTVFDSNTAYTGDGGGANSYYPAAINGAVFQGNRSVNGQGGGLYVADRVVITSAQFIANTAFTNGGGAYALINSDIVSSTFQNNSTANGNGGGLYGDDLMFITGTQFITNTAYNQGGGAYIFADADVAGSLFRANSTTTGDGGGLYAAYTLYMTGTQVLTNSSGNQGGGIAAGTQGVYFVDPIVATIANSWIQGNAALAGGGLFGDITHTITTTNSSFVNNTASNYGGGVFGCMGTTINIANTTLSANGASANGGGAYVYTTSVMSLLNVTFSGNSAPASSGGGLYSRGSVNFQNTIVANSTGGNCAGKVISMTDNGYNLDSADNCAFATGKHSLINALPVLGPLQLNAPGSTPTHKLMPGSQAIDAGTCTGAPVTDQRGAPRPGPTSIFCDIGAYELQTATSDIMVDKKLVTANPIAGQAVTYTLTISNAGDGLAAGVLVTDSLPAGVSFITYTRSGAVITQTSSSPPAWSVQNLGYNQTGIITVTALIASDIAKGSVITNTAAVSSVSLDASSANNMASAGATVGAQADLQLTKSSAWVTATNGITFTIYFTNAGPSVANDVYITDALPLSLTFGAQAGMSLPLYGPTVTTGALTWYTPTLQAGAGGVIVFTTQAVPGGSGWMTNTATITSTVSEATSVNNTGSAAAFILGYRAYLPVLQKP